jgi:hypothetical protein
VWRLVVRQTCEATEETRNGRVQREERRCVEVKLIRNVQGGKAPRVQMDVDMDQGP